MAELTITTASHFFRITKITPRARAAVENFARKFVQYGFQRQGRDYFKAALKVYAASTFDRSEYRFHINTYSDFERHLEANYITGDMVEHESLALYEPAKATFEINSVYKDREEQTSAIEYLLSEERPLAKFISMATGTGKSYVSMRAMQMRAVRTLIIVKPMYIDKWIDDMQRTMVLDDGDIMVIRGSSQLMALLLMAQDNVLNSKIILISNKTMQNWFKLWEKFKFETLGMGYACAPEEICKHLKIGIRLIDEVHQDFFLNFKLSLYTNVPHSISLSATLLSDDDFMNRIYEITYPASLRFKGKAYVKYIAATAVMYKLKYPNKIRCKDAVSKNYSHHLFEQSILRSDSMAANYLDLIKKVIVGTYLKDYKPGQKCLIFCISIDMCSIVTDYLKKTYSNLKVGRYVEEDPWEALMESDICVTTLQSAGTAVDIANLTTVILTTVISSSQSNIQSLGRLRQLKDGTTPRFLYFVCTDIPKHIEYHEKKRVMLLDRTISYQNIFISEPI